MSVLGEGTSSVGTQHWASICKAAAEEWLPHLAQLLSIWQETEPAGEWMWWEAQKQTALPNMVLLVISNRNQCGVPDKDAGMIFVWKCKVTVEVSQSQFPQNQRGFLLCSTPPGIPFAPLLPRANLSPILIVKNKAVDMSQGWLSLPPSSFARKVYQWAPPVSVTHKLSTSKLGPGKTWQ